MNQNYKKPFYTRMFLFYYEGFKNSRTGTKLLILILIKLFIMFFILKLFFFPNFLNSKFDTDKEKSEHVLRQLTKKSIQL